MNEFIQPQIEKATHDIESLIENLNVLENTGWLPSEEMDEIAYYLLRIANIVGMSIDIDRINDQLLQRAAE
jgi:hypothetical protein